MTRRAPTVRHRDRRIAVSQHAVERMRERAGAQFLDDERIRLLIAEACVAALATDQTEPHYIPGQVRVRVQVLGCAVFAVLGVDLTGWGRGSSRRAVVTVLTSEQIEASCARAAAAAARRA